MRTSIVRRQLTLRPLLPFLIALSSLRAQVTVPPIHDFGPVTARAFGPFGAIGQVVPLSDGRVALTDIGTHQLVLLDSTLQHRTVVLDSNPAHSYGRLGGTLLRFVADTIMFADQAGQALVVMDPTGAIVRTMALPPGPPSIGPLSPHGIQMDADGRVAYLRAVAYGCGDPKTKRSTPILHGTLRRADTAGFTLQDLCPSNAPRTSAPDGSSLVGAPRRVPFQQHDQWALLPDGGIALVRAQDYTIDWVEPDGRGHTTPRVAHEWSHLDDAAKAAIVDSLSAYFKANPIKQVLSGGSRMISAIVVEPTALADYLPAFGGPIWADAENRLWIPLADERVLQTMVGRSVGPTVYDVVNRAGVLVDRVRLPLGSTLVGLGRGVAYLTSVDGDTASLVRVRLDR